MDVVYTRFFFLHLGVHELHSLTKKNTSSRCSKIDSSGGGQPAQGKSCMRIQACTRVALAGYAGAEALGTVGEMKDMHCRFAGRQARAGRLATLPHRAQRYTLDAYSLYNISL